MPQALLQAPQWLRSLCMFTQPLEQQARAPLQASELAHAGTQLPVTQV